MKSSKVILLLLFCGVLSLIFYSRSFFSGQLFMIEDNITVVRDHHVRHLSEVIDAQVKMNKVPLHLSKLIVTTHPEIKQYLESQIIKQIAEIEQSVIFERSNTSNSADKVLYEYVAHNWTGYKQFVLYTIASDKKGATDEAHVNMERSLVRLERVNDGMKMLITFHERDVGQKTNQIIDITKTSRYNTFLFTAGALLAFFFIGFVAFSKIISTENKLRDQVLELAEKNQLLEEKSGEIRRLAYQDILTGLPNRLAFQNAFYKELSNSVGASGKGALVFLDIDNFKQINDTYGHDIGDDFLVAIANRMNALLTDDIYGARFGGDEFAFFLRGFDQDSCRVFLEDLLSVVAQPIEIEDRVICPSFSAGVSFYPEQGQRLVDVLKKADIAMYQAKVRKSSYVFYNENKQEEITL